MVGLYILALVLLMLLLLLLLLVKLHQVHLLLPTGVGHEGKSIREIVALVPHYMILLGSSSTVGPLGVWEEEFALGGRRASGVCRWLRGVAGGVVEGVPGVLLQSLIVDDVVVGEGVRGLVGVES